MELFKQGTGLSTNKQECHILLCGSARAWDISDEYNEIEVNVIKYKFSEMMFHLGYSNKNIQKVVKKWKWRNLSILGKVLIMKSLLLSKLWFMV